VIRSVMYSEAAVMIIAATEVRIYKINLA
jgi:hypothetical protein